MWRTVATGQAVANGDVWAAAGVMAEQCARGEVEALSVQAGWAWRSGRMLGMAQTLWARLCSGGPRLGSARGGDRGWRFGLV